MKQNTSLIAAGIAVLIVAAAIVVWRMPTHLGLDLVGGVRGVFLAESQSTTDRTVSQENMTKAITVIDERVNKLGVSEALVQQKGSNQLIVEIPLANPGQAAKLTADKAQKALMDVVKPAVLAFYAFPENITVTSAGKNSAGEETFAITGPGGQPMTEKQALAMAGKPLLTGKDLLSDASAQIDPNNPNDFAVTLHFGDNGTRVFADFTTKAVKYTEDTGQKRFFAVVLDNHIITYPYVKSPILDGSGEISGGFASLDDAQHLATLLNAGALPVNLTPVQTSLIEATLGATSVHTSVWAGLVGLILVIFFMWGYYRLPGVLASGALLIYALLTFAMFKLIPVTLTLPGIAGFILSVGMAVDANILIFERTKEELRDGRTLRSAIDAGFGRAFTAIFDSNACTLITCAVLGFYGTGPVKGFAVTLAIGVVLSLFTAITVTRTFLHLLDNMTSIQKPEYFGIDVQWMGKWAQGKDIIGSRKWFYMLSLAVIVPGLLFLCAGQLKRGVDFTGGNEWIIASQQRVTDREVTKALTEAGIARSHYDMQIGRDLRTGDIQVTIHSKPNEVPQSIQPRVLANLQAAGVKDARTVENEMVEPLIGREQEQNAFLAVVMASILIVLYLSFRFAQGGFKEGLKYGVCAVIAMLHDVFVVVGLFAIFGFFMGIEVDMTFVTAVLTIIGFSVHDTIVIFDRVRENLRKRSRDETFDHVYNRSIIQTAARSINTSFTVILVLMALVLFGAPVIRWFNIALLIGIISGTYSSIFNASPLVVDWQHIKRRRELALRTASKTAAATTMKSSATQVKSGAAPTRPTIGSATLRERGGFGSAPSRPTNSTSPGEAPSDTTPEARSEAATPGEVGADAGGWPEPGRQGLGQPARARPGSGRVSPRRKQRH